MGATAVTRPAAVALDTLGRRIMPRRFRPLAEKRRIAQEASQPGVSVAEVARRYGLNANLVFVWRRLEQQGLLGSHTLRGNVAAMMPVKLLDATAEPTPGTLRIEFLGGVQLHISGAVDAALVERVIAQLRR
ncbi:MAG: transposase [Steroidobacteraceae bacterium]